MAGRWLLRGAAVGLVLTATYSLAGVALAQGRRFFDARAMPTPEHFDGGFNFCRVMFRGNRFGRGGGWGVDYPRADINLSIRLSELTRTKVSVDAQREPKHVLLSLSDEALFQCPFVMMTEVGSLFLDETEAAQLRLYLEKGGFLWVDDFWGDGAWEVFESEIRKALPAPEFPVAELAADHTLFRTHFVVESVPQIPSINFWAGTGGGTSERGYDSAVPRAMGITDENGQLLVLATHNTDIGDSWEREADDPSYFYEFGPRGYGFGINVVLYAMTH